MNKTCFGIIALLLLITGSGAYQFIFQGSIKESSDSRILIQLNAGERDLVLEEMRMFLASIQQITKAATENNMKIVSKSARKVGMAAQAAVPGTLIGKLPIEFKKLGFDTHLKFDEIALNADDFGDINQILTQLSVLMENCVGCHAAYRIDISETKSN